MADSERELIVATARCVQRELFQPLTRGKKKGPAKRVPRSAGLAICSPRGIGEPHDIAPRGSWHLSCVSICFAEGRSQEPVNQLCGTNARLPHVSASQRISNQSLILHGPLMHVQGVEAKRKPH